MFQIQLSEDRIYTDEEEEDRFKKDSSRVPSVAITDSD
jgi:hypothetical protein